MWFFTLIMLKDNSQQLSQEEQQFFQIAMWKKMKYWRIQVGCRFWASPNVGENLNHLPELLWRMSDLCCWPSLLCNLPSSLSSRCTPTSFFHNLTLMQNTTTSFWPPCIESWKCKYVGSFCHWSISIFQYLGVFIYLQKPQLPLYAGKSTNGIGVDICWQIIM